VETLPRDVYEGGHLPGALNLPFASEEEIPDLARGLLPDKDAEIVLYCGGRL
jgi:rhodanese-related sulfurtransferase